MAAVAVDRYPGQDAGIVAPSSSWAPITPSDTVPLPFVPKAVHNNGTAGVATLVGADGVQGVFYFAQGATLPVRPHFVRATSFGAGVSLVALY